MSKNECRITISEVDGKLAIFANVPDAMKKTIAGALTEALMGKSAEIMNEVLGEDQRVQVSVRH